MTIEKEFEGLKYHEIDLKLEINDEKDLPYYCPDCKKKLKWERWNECWRIHCEKCKKSWDITFNINHV